MLSLQVRPCRGAKRPHELRSPGGTTGGHHDTGRLSLPSKDLWRVVALFLSFSPHMFEKRANNLLFALCAILSLLSHHRGKKRSPPLGKSVWRTYSVLRRNL